MLGDRILVVDDEVDLLNLAKIILDKRAYQVILASNGEEALLKADIEKPDLILLDIVMPGKSGFEVCKTLKEQQKTLFIPIVMFTALGRDVDKKMSKEAGADGHLTKPFTPEDLVAEVEKHLEAARPSKFSGALGLSHEQIKERKMLLEFDPSTPYERCVRDLAVEAQTQGEAITILTPKGSSIYQTFEGENGVDLVPLTAETVHSSWLILEKDFDESLVLVYDNLSDLILTLGFDEAYGFTRNVLERLVDLRVTALFLLNPNAHSPKEISSFRSLFSDQVTFGGEGLTKIRLL